MTTATLHIRAYDEGDESAVVALWQQAFPGDPGRNEPRSVIRRKLGVQRHLFLVGELAGDVVATAMAGFDGFRGWVYHVAVREDLRQRGFGAEMMHAVERELRSVGCQKLNLQVRATNEVVVRFYQALGYTIEERVSMGKVLEPPAAAPEPHGSSDIGPA